MVAMGFGEVGVFVKRTTQGNLVLVEMCNVLN